MRPSKEHQPPRVARLPRRTTDRLEDLAAWLLTAAALFVLLGAAFIGVGLYGDTVERGRSLAHERTPVAAVLAEGAVTADPLPNGPGGALVLRSARYVDAAGGAHEVIVTVPPGLPAGVTVPVWVDRQGRMVASPPSRLEAVVLGGSAATGIVLVGCSLLVSAWLGLRSVLATCNAREWAREWELVEPAWSGRR